MTRIERRYVWYINMYYWFVSSVLNSFVFLPTFKEEVPKLLAFRRLVVQVEYIIWTHINKVLKNTLKPCSGNQDQCSLHGPGSGFYRDGHLSSSIFLCIYSLINVIIRVHGFIPLHIHAFVKNNTTGKTSTKQRCFPSNYEPSSEPLVQTHHFQTNTFNSQRVVISGPV